MAETKRVITGEQRLLWANEILPDQRHQPAVHLLVFRRQREHGPPVEDLALDGAPFEHASLCFVELVETRREQRLDRRGDRDFGRSVPLATLGEHRKHLANEQGIPAGCLEDPRSQELVDLRAGQEPLDQLPRLIR